MTKEKDGLSICDLTVKELKDDYKSITNLGKLIEEIEEKYEDMGVVFGNYFGLLRRIQEEIGRRSLLND